MQDSLSYNNSSQEHVELRSSFLIVVRDPRSYKLFQSFQLDLARHTQSDRKQWASSISKTNSGMNLSFWTCFSIHKYMSMIQYIHIKWWSTPEHPKSRFQYQVCNMLRLNGAIMIEAVVMIWSLKWMEALKEEIDIRLGLGDGELEDIFFIS